MTAGGICAFEAMLPSQGGGQGVADGSAEGQGTHLAQPSKSAVATAAQTVQADMNAGSQSLTKAGMLTQCLLEPAAFLAMLGFSAKEVGNSELQTQQQEVASMTQTQAGAQLSSIDGPQAAKIGTAAAAAGTEAAEAAAGHPLTNDLYVGINHTFQADEQQASGKKDSGGSLLALLGLDKVTEGSGRRANGIAPAGACEEAGLQVDRKAGIALHVVEALLNAALTQPELSGFPSLALPLLLPPPPGLTPPAPSSHAHPLPALSPAIPAYILPLVPLQLSTPKVYCKLGLTTSFSYIIIRYISFFIVGALC